MDNDLVTVYLVTKSGAGVEAQITLDNLKDLEEYLAKGDLVASVDYNE